MNPVAPNVRTFFIGIREVVQNILVGANRVLVVSAAGLVSGAGAKEASWVSRRTRVPPARCMLATPLLCYAPRQGGNKSLMAQTARCWITEHLDSHLYVVRARN